MRNPEEKVWRLPLMSEGERLEVLERSRGEAKEYEDKERCVHELVAREANGMRSGWRWCVKGKESVTGS